PAGRSGDRTPPRFCHMPLAVGVPALLAVPPYPSCPWLAPESCRCRLEPAGAGASVVGGVEPDEREPLPLPPPPAASATAAPAAAMPPTIRMLLPPPPFFAGAAPERAAVVDAGDAAGDGAGRGGPSVRAS